MANLAEQNIWEDGIYQLEETDVVLAGPDGIANQQANQLANRTLYLKNAMRGFVAFTFLSSGKALTIDEVQQKLVVVNANSASIALTLPAVNSDNIGLVVSILAYNVVQQVTIQSSASNIAFLSTRQRVFLGNFEIIKLTWTGTSWLIIDFPDNMLTVGQPVYGYTQLPNTIIANGQLLLRADYLRLYEYVQSLTGSVVSESQWNNTQGYRGFFTTGTNSTNFRIPDLRGMFIRSLDLGAGVSFSRNNANAGGYEADAIIEHYHMLNLNPNANSDGGFGKITTGGDQPEGSLPLYKSQGAINAANQAIGTTETRVKNIGLIPLIKV